MKIIPRKAILPFNHSPQERWMRSVGSIYLFSVTDQFMYLNRLSEPGSVMHLHRYFLSSCCGSEKQTRLKYREEKRGANEYPSPHECPEIYFYIPPSMFMYLLMVGQYSACSCVVDLPPAFYLVNLCLVCLISRRGACAFFFFQNRRRTT